MICTNISPEYDPDPDCWVPKTEAVARIITCTGRGKLLVVSVKGWPDPSLITTGLEDTVEKLLLL